MAEIDLSIILHHLANNLYWGVVKSEKRMTGRTIVYSKMVGEEMSTLFLKMLEQFGIVIEPKATPIQTIEASLEVLKESGIFSPNEVDVKVNNSEMELIIKNCPFSIACSKLIQEGISDFGCIQLAIFSQVAKKSAKEFTGKTTIQPGNCKLHFNQ